MVSVCDELASSSLTKHALLRTEAQSLMSFFANCSNFLISQAGLSCKHRIIPGFLLNLLMQETPTRRQTCFVPLTVDFRLTGLDLSVPPSLLQHGSAVQNRNPTRAQLLEGKVFRSSGAQLHSHGPPSQYNSSIRTY